MLKNLTKIKEMDRVHSAVLRVPQVFIGDRYLGDDDVLARLAGSGELSAMMS